METYRKLADVRMFMRDFVLNPILKLLDVLMNVFYYHLHLAEHVWLWMMS